MKRIIKVVSLMLIVCMLFGVVCSCDELLNSTESSKIVLTKGSKEFEGENFEEVKEYFQNLGFTNIKLVAEMCDDIEKNGTAIEVVVVDWIIPYNKFDSGDEFPSDCTIEIYYNKFDDSDKSVFYSTNDYETATRGNTGMFSYKNKKGSYDIYWIIDFDEGYVYFFTDGNGESSCDKLAIVSGDLNDRIIIRWDKDTEWYLHFKYVESPATLIVNDHLGGASEFTTTDLDDALELRDTKAITIW